MAIRRLVNIATELNVATTTVVEYLSTNGYDIENKPTAKISDEMYELLRRQFRGSLAVKEQANKQAPGRNKAQPTFEPLQEINERPTKITSVIEPLESLHKREDLCVISYELNWSLLSIMNSKPKYKGQTNITSNLTTANWYIYLKYLQLTHQYYLVGYYKGQVIHVAIPRPVMDQLKVVQQVHPIISEASKDRRVSTRFPDTASRIALLRLISKEKDEYFTFLSRKHDNSFPVVCIWDKFTQDVIKATVLFTTSRVRTYVIWETFDLFNATYVFRIKPTINPLKAIGIIEEFVSRPFSGMRSSLRSKIPDLLTPAVDSISFVIHDNTSETDIRWVRSMLDRLA